MSTTTHFTAEQLLRLPSGEKRYELIRGELIMMSPGNWRHGMVIGEIEYWITRFVKERRLGRVCGAETGFVLETDPDTVRAPDIAVLLNRTLEKRPDASAYWPGSPDVAVEVLSPSDSRAKTATKTEDWFAGGATEVWVVDIEKRTITRREKDQPPREYSKYESFQGGAALRGFELQVDQVFECLD